LGFVKNQIPVAIMFVGITIESLLLK